MFTAIRTAIKHGKVHDVSFMEGTSHIAIIIKQGGADGFDAIGVFFVFMKGVYNGVSTKRPEWLRNPLNNKT